MEAPTLNPPGKQCPPDSRWDVVPGTRPRSETPVSAGAQNSPIFHDTSFPRPPSPPRDSGGVNAQDRGSEPLGCRPSFPGRGARDLENLGHESSRVDVWNTVWPVCRVMCDVGIRGPPEVLESSLLRCDSTGVEMVGSEVEEPPKGVPGPSAASPLGHTFFLPPKNRSHRLGERGHLPGCLLWWGRRREVGKTAQVPSSAGHDGGGVEVGAVGWGLLSVEASLGTSPPFSHVGNGLRARPGLVQGPRSSVPVATRGWHTGSPPA